LAGGRATFLRLFFASRRLGDSAESGKAAPYVFDFARFDPRKPGFPLCREPRSNRRGVDRRISPPLILRDDLKA
jgi:hypothetical protein